jgi:hypothetical protein
LWLKADEFLVRRRWCQSFYVPDEADEFLHYLIKKVLKQQITGPQLRLLSALYSARPAECCERLRRFWSEAEVRTLTSTLVTQDLDLMRLKFPELLKEIQASHFVERPFKRLRQRLLEYLRVVERIAHPTGLNIRLCGGSAQQRATVASALEHNLRPAFRRTKIVGEAEQGLRSAIEQWAAKVRSTLVIQTDGPAPKSWLMRDEILFDLGDATNQPVEHLTRVSLRWMAQRLEQRFTGRKVSRNVADLAVSVRV